MMRAFHEISVLAVRFPAQRRRMLAGNRDEFKEKFWMMRKCALNDLKAAEMTGIRRAAFQAAAAWKARSWWVFARA
jgi:hypothetical protein